VAGLAPSRRRAATTLVVSALAACVAARGERVERGAAPAAPADRGWVVAAQEVPTAAPELRHRVHAPFAQAPGPERPAATASPTITGEATRGPSPSPPPSPSSTMPPSPTPSATTPAGAARPWPDTSEGIHVFNDQLPGLGNLTDAQIRFAATRYAGTQKMTRPDADRLRAIEPGFLILHYRLGIGLGYRTADERCQPTGPAIQIVDGDRWVEEWPGEGVVQPAWFFGFGGEPRVFFCPFGWYLMDVADPGYRDWWLGEVARQMAANDADGLFADSTSVPNYFGGSIWRPELPPLDAAFEADWTHRLDDWLVAIKARLGDRYALLPNVGGWITTRDATTYAAADGVMIEGFASASATQLMPVGDWVLQMDRILALTGRGGILIAQHYPDGGVRDRMFHVASYLLVKGPRSFLNMEAGMWPEWWPEYDLPVGRYAAPPPARVGALYDAGAGVYRRAYERAEVLVNPGPESRTVTLPAAAYRAVPEGGGAVPPDGTAPGALRYERVEGELVLEPGEGAVLFGERP